MTPTLDEIADAVEFLPSSGFQVRERATGIVRTITNVEMMACMHRTRQLFEQETTDETTCCGGLISDCGICSRFPGRTCVYLTQAWALLKGE